MGWPPSEIAALFGRHGFNSAQYVEWYPDIGTADQAIGHYSARGLLERRLGAMVDPGSQITPVICGIDALSAEAQPQAARLFVSILAYHQFISTGWPGAGGRGLLADIDDEQLEAMLALGRHGLKPFLIIGDSHSRALSHWLGAFEGLVPLMHNCSGGSARGLGNPTSRMGFGSHVRHQIQRVRELALPSRTPILMQFGQVDLEFVYPFERIKRGETGFSVLNAQAFVDETVRRYVRFLSSLHRYRIDMRLVGVFPPALSDEQLKRGYVNGSIAFAEGMSVENLERQIAELDLPDMRLRTWMHMEFNRRLGEEAVLLGVPFIDPLPRLVSGDRVSPEFLGAGGGTDHHLDFERTEPVLTKMLVDALR